MKNPHALIRLVKGKNLWKCTSCGIIGTLKELLKSECTYKYPPCKYCGQTPICAPDCKGIIEVLEDPSIYLAGGNPRKEN